MILSRLETMSSVLHVHAFLARCFNLARSHLRLKPVVEVLEDRRVQVPAVARPLRISQEGARVALGVEDVNARVKVMMTGDLRCT